MACRSGCKSKSCESYAACLRAARPQMPAVLTSPVREVYDRTKGDLAAYKSARSHGIQPESTSVEKVRQAQTATEFLGRPYNAESDPPAKLITSKTTAKFVNWKD